MPPTSPLSGNAVLRHNPEQADRFIGTIAGTVAISQFFAPENLGPVTAGPPATVG
jgi:hypothetical protein